MNFFQIVKKNFLQRLVRNGILILCVASVVGTQISALIIEESSQNGLKIGLKKLGADLIAVPRGLKQELITSYMSGRPALFYMGSSIEERLSSHSYIEQVSVQLYIQSLSKSSCCSIAKVFLIGFDPESDFTLSPWLTGVNQKTLKKNEIIVGAAIGVDKGDILTFYGQKYKVTGVLDPGNMGLDMSIFVPLESAYEMTTVSDDKAEKNLVVKPDQISAVLIKLKDETNGGLPSWKVAHLLEKEIPEISIIRPSDMIIKVQKNLSGVLKSLRSVSYAVWPITALLIGLVFAMAANERKSEIGLLRAIGATRFFIFRAIILESLIIAILGGILGSVVSVGIVFGFSSTIAHSLETPFSLPSIFAILLTVGGSTMLALATCIFSATIPAFAASKMEPYEAIRMGKS